MTLEHDPLSDFSSWFAALDREVQTDIGGFVLISADAGMNHEDIPGAMIQWLKRDGSAMRGLGRIGLLRTVMEICLARQRVRPEFWARGAAMSAVLGAKVRSQGHEDFADRLSTLNQGSQDRQAAWQFACAGWSALTTNSWSDEKLELWFDEAMRLPK